MATKIDPIPVMIPPERSWCRGLEGTEDRGTGDKRFV